MPTDAKPRGKFFYSPLPQQEGHGEFFLRLVLCRLMFWEMEGFAWQTVTDGIAVVWYEELRLAGNVPLVGQAAGVDLWSYQLEKLLASMEHLLPAKIGQVEPFEIHDDDKSYLVNVLRTERIVYFQWDEIPRFTHVSFGKRDKNNQPRYVYKMTDDAVVYDEYVTPVPFWKFWRRSANNVRA